VLNNLDGNLALAGLLSLGQGALLTSMLWAAAMALIIERRFLRASVWLAAAAVLSAAGVIHAWRLTPAGIEGRIGWWVAPQFALSYAAGAIFLVLCAWWARHFDPADRASFSPAIPPRIEVMEDEWE
jgi:AGZA family xanthine/uracil permease-like MFS transporter